jgi:hypothetical protein
MSHAEFAAGLPGSGDFTITLPSAANHDARIAAIRSRGNLPLLIADDILAEINHHDLAESWRSTMALPALQLASMSQAAASRLGEILESECSCDNISELITDAAVVFLLAMRRQGLSSVKRLSPCCVKWHGQDHQESVSLLA